MYKFPLIMVLSVIWHCFYVFMCTMTLSQGSVFLYTQTYIGYEIKLYIMSPLVPLSFCSSCHSCVSDLSIDAMDVAGEQQLDVEHNLFKQRLDKDSKPISTEAEKHGWYNKFD